MFTFHLINGWMVKCKEYEIKGNGIIISNKDLISIDTPTTRLSKPNKELLLQIPQLIATLVD
jgi:hypothetical protein